MKSVIRKSILFALMITLLAAPMAGAELSPMDSNALRKINAQAGTLTIGMDSLLETEGFLKTGFDKEAPRSYNKNFDRVNFGFLEQAPVLTMTDVELSGAIQRGSSYTEFYPEEGPGEFNMRHHFDNYQITLDHFSTDAIYPAGKTNGSSYGALEISGARMRISGDVYVGIRQ